MNKWYWPVVLWGVAAIPPHNPWLDAWCVGWAAYATFNAWRQS